MRSASRLPLACTLAATLLAAACVGQRGARAPPRRAIIHAAFMKLASATEPEAPRPLLAWLPREKDPGCGHTRGEAARIWCHLRRARVRLAGAGDGDGDGDRGAWWVIVELPSLSDHVHVVEVRVAGGAIEAVRVGSAN
ncbi:MAG TPA: hypothetical protein VMZ28_07300 [Kofleriaceae bacterium]|nr:hypothetical protein [Kofleriaceae bacterium]